MPEAPELAVICEVLERRFVGESITGASVPRPTVVRSLAVPDLRADVIGRSVESVTRFGKTLTLTLSGDRFIVVIPMLSGRLHLVPPSDRVRKDTFLHLSTSEGRDLRYTDDRQMGMVYYATATQLGEIPRLEETGPDVLDQPMTADAFSARLLAFHGEIKGILTRGRLVTGVGNAYADEILFDAGISPFRKRADLSLAEVERLRVSVYRVPRDALGMLRDRMGESIHLKPRDFLQVHNKPDQPCPRCGGHISQLSARHRITTYCLRCQPGMLIRN